MTRIYFRLLNVLVIPLVVSISLNTVAADLYSEFSMEQFDNNKPNGFVEFWKINCITEQVCDLSIVAFNCNIGASEKTKPYLDFYSTQSSLPSTKIRNLKMITNQKKFKNPIAVSFQFSQFFGPDLIDCTLEMSKENVTKAQEATCQGKGVWTAGTKYTREWKLIKGGPFLLEKICKTKIEFP